MTIRHALTAAAGNTGPAPAPTDPQFNYVSMLLHGDGTNGAQNNTFVPTPITAPASGYYAGYFDGNGDYLTVPDNAAFNFGSGDLTVEMWLYPTAPGQSGYTFIYTKPNGTGYSGVAIIQDPSSYAIKLYCSSTGSSWDLVNGATIGTLPANTWSHVAVSRSGANVLTFLNGVLGSTTAISTSSLLSTTSAVHVGSSLGNANTFFTGYVSNLRVVKGTAVYTAAFTPPTAPLTAISGTSLLTCMSGTGVTFADLSTNNFTITANGNAAVTGVATTPPSAAPYAGYFNGSAKLTVPAGTAFAYGTGDFTVEGWFYATTNLPAYGATLFAQTVSGTNYFWCLLGDGQFSPAQKVTFTFATSGGGTGVVSGATTYTQNTWNHFAIVRSSGSVTVYLNGVGGTPVACTQDFTNTTYVPTIAQYSHSTGNAFTGYLSNFRIVKGTAVYTSNFAPPSAPLTAISGTSLLTCQNATFVDNSPNNFTVTSSSATVTSSYILPAITRNGNTTQGSLSPYGSLWSNYFDGNGDYLQTPTSTALNFNSVNYTAEAWVYLNMGTYSSFDLAGRGILSDYLSNSYSRWLLTIDSGGKLAFAEQDLSGTNSVAITDTVNMPLNQWVHTAICKSGTTMYLFKNGVLVGTATSAVRTNFGGRLNVGQVTIDPSYRGYFLGYISNARALKGTALYTSNFTPSTSPLTAITNTALLTCQSNRFVDNSPNNFTITVAGDTRVTKEAPFLPTAAYSTSVIGGSGYFDGTGDYLSTSSVTFAGDFTVEGWVYINNLSSNRIMVQIGDDSTATGPAFYVTSTGKFNVYASSTIISGVANIITNTWYHLAVCRSGSTVKSYVNGVLDVTTTNTTTFTGLVRVGAEWFGGAVVSSSMMNGYISNLRLVAGTAVYTTNFTPPTAPLTAPINTSLLLDFTNAGIFDNAAENDLETVGNAQISTSVKKYGTGSMRFTAATDYLIPSESLPCAFGGANFTIEMWVYLNAYPSTYGVMYDARPSGGNGAYAAIYMDATNIYYYVNTTNAITASLSTIGTGTWRHLAVSRSGTSTKMFIDGVQVGSTYTDTTVYLNPAQRPVIGGGGNAVGTYPMNGYIDDLRITKGVARYTANFTPPTAAFPDQ